MFPKYLSFFFFFFDLWKILIFEAGLCCLLARSLSQDLCRDRFGPKGRGMIGSQRWFLPGRGVRPRASRVRAPALPSPRSCWADRLGEHQGGLEVGGRAGDRGWKPKGFQGEGVGLAAGRPPTPCGSCRPTSFQNTSWSSTPFPVSRWVPEIQTAGSCPILGPDPE